MKKLGIGVTVTGVALLVGFPLIAALIVVAVEIPAAQEQLREQQCDTGATTPAADVAGQLRLIQSGHAAAVTKAEVEDLTSAGPDALTLQGAATRGTGGKRSVRPVRPPGYRSWQGAATSPRTAEVLWRTDRWTMTGKGSLRTATWVTLRARSGRVITVISTNQAAQAPAAQAPAAQAPAGLAPAGQGLPGLITALSPRGPVLVGGTGEGGLQGSRMVSVFTPAGRGAQDVVISPDRGLDATGHGTNPTGTGTALWADFTFGGAAAGEGAARGPDSRRPVGVEEGGVGFALPAAGQPRGASVHNRAQPIPARIKGYYLAAAARYKMPWTLLAGIGMEETNHGRNEATSSAGAQGLMQFMPATFARYGVDGNHDGRVEIRSDADSAMSAANYLTTAGVTKGAAGVRKALFAYNHADWYVNDVLAYAHSYGGGTVLGDPTDCGSGAGNPSLPSLRTGRATKMLTWAQAQLGEPYVFGANGPNSWDCSSYTRTAYAQIGITLPRTAQAQRDWLAAGNGFRVSASEARLGDLVFTNTYRGPNAIGHVMLVADPAHGISIEAVGAKVAYDHYTRYAGNHIFEIWRVGNVADQPTTHAS